jgi:hypothetical protein
MHPLHTIKIVSCFHELKREINTQCYFDTYNLLKREVNFDPCALPKPRHADNLVQRKDLKQQINVLKLHIGINVHGHSQLKYI